MTLQCPNSDKFNEESASGTTRFLIALLVILFAIGGGVFLWGMRGRDNFAAIPLNGDAAWYLDFSGRYVPELQDMDLFYHNIGQSVDHAKAADVVLLGPSFMLYAMDNSELQEFGRQHGIKIYNMAFLGVRSGEFARQIIEHWKIHPKLWVINVDDQFTSYFSRSLELTIGSNAQTIPVASYGRLQGYLTAAGRNLRWNWQDASAYLSRYAGPPLPPLGGLYRNVDNGSLDLFDDPSYIAPNNPIIKVSRGQDCHTNPETISIGREYLHAIGGEAVFTLIPHSQYCPLQARELGQALGVETILSPTADYSTVDGGGHLDQKGAKAFTQFFLAQLEKTKAFAKITAQ